MIQVVLVVLTVLFLLGFLGCTAGLITIIVLILKGDGCPNEKELDKWNLQLKILAGFSFGLLILTLIFSTITYVMFMSRITKKIPWKTLFNLIGFVFLSFSIMMIAIMIYWCIRMARGDFCDKLNDFKKQIKIMGWFLLIFIILTITFFTIAAILARTMVGNITGNFKTGFGGIFGKSGSSGVKLPAITGNLPNQPNIAGLTPPSGSSISNLPILNQQNIFSSPVVQQGLTKFMSSPTGQQAILKNIGL